MNFKKLLKQIGAVGGAVGGFGLTVAMFSHGGAPPEVFLVLAGFLGIGTSSAYSLRLDAKKETAQKDLAASKELITLISANNGKTTLTDLMMQLNTPLPELKAKLTELQNEGILGMDVSPTGELLYTVPNALSLKD